MLGTHFYYQETVLRNLSLNSVLYKVHVLVTKIKQRNLVAFSPQANYTSRAIAAADEASAQFCGYRFLCGQRNGFLRPLISVFYTEAATFSFR
jgi:hypothetical protein